MANYASNPTFYQMSLSDYLMSDKPENMLEKYVSDGKIAISESEWGGVKQKYKKDDIISCLSDLILQGEVKIPMVEYEYSEATNSFENLCNYKCNGIQTGNVFTRYEYGYSISDKYIDETNIGNIASNYFQQENRFHCDSINAPSPYRTWNNRKFLQSALSALWSLNVKEINEKTLRTALSLRKYVASQFKPAVAKSIYEYLHSENILDFCSGWGDRLCGFYAYGQGKKYVGIDPNTRLHQKYAEQIKLYGGMTVGKEALMIKAPAEDVILSPNTFDTVFTSPPYFNVERYSNEDTQSFKRYKKLESWLERFLFKAIDMAWEALKPFGYMAINISDVYSNHTINKICDPMNKHIESIGGKYQECIGMKMAKRPNSGALKGKDGVFVEPIWIWQKR